MTTKSFSHYRWGNNIPKLMEIHGYDNKKLSEIMGVTEQAVSELRNHGIKALTPARAAQMQSIFGGIEYYKIFPLVTSADED